MEDTTPKEVDYSRMTNEEFDGILEKVVAKQKAIDLLTIPGIYNILAEHFNNEVLDRWAKSNK